MITARNIGFIVCVLLSGCASQVIQNEQIVQPDDSNHPNLHKGWAVFEDPLLLELFKIAKIKSPDLKIALARIEEARFEEKNVIAGQLPNSQITTRFKRSHDPMNLYLNPLENRIVSNQANFAFDTSWELNLLSIRPALRAVKAQQQQMKSLYQNSLITLYGDIAKAYFTFRKLQNQILFEKKNIQWQKTYVALTNSLNQAGQISGIDVAQSEALLARFQSNLLFLEKKLQDSRYLLEVLIGERPDTLAKKLIQEKPIIIPKNDPTVGLPAKILAYRPDVKAAEAQLMQIISLKEIAMAQYFPTISLSALMGFGGTTFNHLFNSSHRIWSSQNSLTLPFFDFGRIRSDIGKKGAQEKAVMAQYEKTVLNALYEVETTWMSYHFDKKQMHEIQQRVKKSQLALKFATERYQHGLSSYMEVLLMFKEVNEAEQLWVESQASVLIDLVKIYKALGIRDETW